MRSYGSTAGQTVLCQDFPPTRRNESVTGLAKLRGTYSCSTRYRAKVACMLSLQDTARNTRFVVPNPNPVDRFHDVFVFVDTASQ
jgi:hypothetical protein